MYDKYHEMEAMLKAKESNMEDLHIDSDDN